MGLFAQKTWRTSLSGCSHLRSCPLGTVRPRKPGFSPPYEYARARSSPFGLIGPGNLAVRSWTCVLVPVPAVWACTPGKPGCTPLEVCVRARSCLFGPLNECARALSSSFRTVLPINLVRACFGIYAGFTPPFEYIRARSSPVGPLRPKNCGYTLLHECARARLLRFRPVCPENLAVRPWTCMYVPVRARLGLHARETLLYAPGRVSTCPFVPIWACTTGKPGCTLRHECARTRS